MTILSVTEPDEITCPLCEARHKKEAYIIAYTKTLVCHISRGYVVEKEGE